MGSSSGNKVPITEQERAMAEIANESWGRFQESGIPLQDAAITKLTGMERNEDGEYVVAKGGILNMDGSAKIDTAAARTSNERAFTEVQQQAAGNPNRLGALESLATESAKAGSAGGVSQAMEQVASPLRGLSAASAMGQGQQIETSQRQGALAQQAQQDAIQSASNSQARRQAQGSVLGETAGTAGVLEYRRRQGALQESPP